MIPSMTEDVGTVEEFVTLEAGELAFLEEVATQHGVSIEPLETKALEPLSMVTLIVLGAPLAVTTVMRVLDEHRGGQVIDLRPGATRLAYRTRDLMYGLILIHTLDGTIQIERVNTRTAFSELVEAVARVAVGGAGEDHATDAVRGRLERQLPAGQARVDTQPTRPGPDGGT
jgi:hypothetical protein